MVSKVRSVSESKNHLIEALTCLPLLFKANLLQTSLVKGSAFNWMGFGR